MWPVLGLALVISVKLLRVVAEPVRIAAHLVQGDEPVVVVESRVLDSLGHDRTSELLESHDEFTAQFRAAGVHMFEWLEKEQTLKKIPYARLDLWGGLPGILESLLNET